jgi:hypothetical protein
MKQSISRPAARFQKITSPDDPTLLEFVNTLRRSVKAKVLVERRRGLPLAEIVVRVREMVRLREEATNPATPSSSLAFRAITKCAVGWCIDAYLPAGVPRYTSMDRFPLRSPV